MSTLPVVPITVLVAIDYSDASSLVAQQAVAAARREKATEIHFLHVRSTSPGVDEPDLRLADLEHWLAARLQGADSVPHTLKVVAHEAVGKPADVIVDMARDLLASVIVVGTHGRKGLPRMVMGSVAEAVMRNAGCSVLVARPRTHEPTVPSIEPPCPRCLEARAQSGGKQFWCEQHSEKHGRRHTYYDTRQDTWVNHRITL